MSNYFQQFGVNYFADFNAVTGLGEAVRGNLRALKSHGVDVKKIHLKLSENSYPFFERFDQYPEYSINILHLNPGFQFKKLFQRFKPSFFKEKYNISYWAWETSVFPKKFKTDIDKVDEIWVPSHFVKYSIEKVTNKPVFVVPHVIENSSSSSTSNYQSTNNPFSTEAFIFLNIFDFGSAIERKNTLELIEVFKETFQDDKNICLILKALPHPNFQNDVLKVHSSIKNSSNIILIKEVLTQEALNLLMQQAQVYISMHCAEGFGINLAQAMLLGKPVIATGYSGNMDFMNNENSFPIPYKLSKIKTASKTFSPKTIWAYPDNEEAGRIMRWVVENYDDALKIAAKGKEFVEKNLNSHKIGSLMVDRLKTIHENEILRSKKVSPNLVRKLKSLLRF